MTRIAFAAALLCLAAVPALAQGQPTPPVGPDFSKVEVKTIDLGHDTWMMSNGISGNVTVAAGKDAIIMVDGQHAPMHDKLKAAIAAVSKLPVKYLVNTHHHGDHTGGNAAFAADGVTIVGNIHLKKILAAGGTNNNSMAKVPPAPPEALPKQTYTDAMILKIKGRRATIEHPSNAHTGGDSFVWFRDANVLSTGDTFVKDLYPNIDWLNGGSIDGMITANATYLRLANDKTKIVPGHGALATKADVKAFRDMLVEAKKRMVKLVKEGKTEEQIQDAKPFADFDGKYAANERAAKRFVTVMYFNVKK